jgi:hypothetical protein
MKTKIKEFLKLKKYKPSHCIDTLYTLENFLTEFAEFMVKETSDGAMHAESFSRYPRNESKQFAFHEGAKWMSCHQPVIDNTTTPPGIDEDKKTEDFLDGFRLAQFNLAVNKEALFVLSELVILKAYKDRHGKDDYYQDLQPKLWEKAKQVIMNIDVSSLECPDCSNGLQDNGHGNVSDCPTCEGSGNPEPKLYYPSVPEKCATECIGPHCEGCRKFVPVAEPQIDDTKVIRVPPQTIKEGNEFPEAREIDGGAAESGMDDRMGIISGFVDIKDFLENKIRGCDELGGMEKEKWAFQQCIKELGKDIEPQISVEAMAMKIRIATGQPMSMSRVIAKALKRYYIDAKVVGAGDISDAASAYEKIACCEKDHPFLKTYVNEDFVAGAIWMLDQ